MLPHKPAGKCSKAEPVCRNMKCSETSPGIYRDLEKKEGGKYVEKRGKETILLKQDMPLKQQLFEEFCGKSFR